VIPTFSSICGEAGNILKLALTHLAGTGLSLFGGTISAIYYFKPQAVSVSTVFLAVITYMLGELMAVAIPRKGIIGRWFNPHPFNVKEHLAIVIMANSASISAAGIEVLVVERLYYGAKVNGALSVFLLFSSQFLGYGIAGLMRKVLVYPKNMLWPANLHVNSMLETLHRPRELTRKPLKVFLIVFTCIFVWEIIPEWIYPF
jgi:OPT oligopeptide transporter protein